MTILGQTESFKTMNRPNPSRFHRDVLWYIIYRKVQEIGTWNFDTIQVFNLLICNLRSMTLTVWKLCAFRQPSNFDNFEQFFHKKFRLKGKLWILMDSSERSSSDLSEYTLFVGGKWKIVSFFSSVFVLNTPKVQWFCKCRWLHNKKSKSIRLQRNFYSE